MYKACLWLYPKDSIGQILEHLLKWHYQGSYYFFSEVWILIIFRASYLIFSFVFISLIRTSF